MRYLITGASGFLGKELVSQLRERGHTVYGLFRKPPKTYIPVPLIGDITKLDLGLEDIPEIDAVIHSAALLDLGDKHKDEIWETNVDGTRNVLKFIETHNIPRLVFCSTAYTQGRNYYEESKGLAEHDILQARVVQGTKVSIVKPSIIIGSPKNPGTDQAINHVAITIARVYQRFAAAREKVEDTLALPPLELGFRLKGDPEATLNVIPVDVVAKEVFKAQGKEGIFYIANPNPPMLREVANEVGEALGLSIHIQKEFKHSPPELLLEKLIKPFLPYIKDSPSLPTIVESGFKLPRGYIRDTVKAFLKVKP